MLELVSDSCSPAGTDTFVDNSSIFRDVPAEVGARTCVVKPPEVTTPRWHRHEATVHGEYETSYRPLKIVQKHTFSAIDKINGGPFLPREHLC